MSGSSPEFLSTRSPHVFAPHSFLLAKVEFAIACDPQSAAAAGASPDAELGGDPYSTKASGGYWLELSSPCGTRKWPLGFSIKKAGHTSGSTADSETWSLVGANDSGLKREVIPVLAQLEVSLRRPVKLICKEDNTACITQIQPLQVLITRYPWYNQKCTM